MNYTRQSYDDAIDRREYYSSIVDSLSAALVAIDELHDQALDTDALVDVKTYCEDKRTEFDTAIEVMNQIERRASKSGIPFYDPEPMGATNG